MTDPYYDEIKDQKTREERYESATIDCYGEDELLSGICMYAEEYLKFPFNAKIKDCGDTIFEITVASHQTAMLIQESSRFAEAEGIKTKVPLSEIIPVNPSERNKMIIEDYREWNNYF